MQQHTRKMQSSSHKLTTPVAESVYANLYIQNSLVHTEIDDASGVRHLAHFMSAGFDSGLKHHTEEL